MKIRFKSCKIDPFCIGMSNSLSKVSCITCPITDAIQYLCHRDVIPGLRYVNSPLFCLANSEPLTRKLFLYSINRLCQACGLNPCHYSGHSMCTGAATSAAQQNVADHLIQALGRWSSDCYKTYIRTSPDVLHKAHKALTNICWLSCRHVPLLPNPSTNKTTSMSLPSLWFIQRSIPLVSKLIRIDYLRFSIIPCLSLDRWQSSPHPHPSPVSRECFLCQNSDVFLWFNKYISCKLEFRLHWFLISACDAQMLGLLF